MAEITRAPKAADAEAAGTEWTFLIADIRGYTRFTREHGDADAARLAQTFAALAEQAVEGRDGRVVEVRGDEVMAVFALPEPAIRAAIELVALCDEERRDDLPLLAGIGVETGPAVAVGDGFRGAALNTAARLCSTAEAGEVLLASALAERVGALEDVAFARRGTAELKGIDRPLELTTAAPARRPQGAVPARPDGHSTLPADLLADAALSGRRRELAWLSGAWRRARRGSGSVVFATGPAGIGKTRMAAELASVVVRDAGEVVYVGAGGTAVALAQAALADALESDAAKLVVLDDLDAIGESLVPALADPAIRTRPVLVLGLVRERERVLGLPQLLEHGSREGGGHRVLPPLDATAVHDIAATYAGAYVDEAPLEEIGRVSGGVPARVHELLEDWAGQEATRRLAAAAEWLAAERLDRSADLDFANSVIGRKLARLYTPEQRDRDAPAGPCPYKGLASFEAVDAPFFFGRERLVGELAARTVGVGCSPLWALPAAGSPQSSPPASCPRLGRAFSPAASAGRRPCCGRANIPNTSSRPPSGEGRRKNVASS